MTVTVSGQLTSRPLYTRYQLKRGSVGPSPRLDAQEKTKNPCLCQELNPDSTVVHNVAWSPSHTHRGYLLWCSSSSSSNSSITKYFQEKRISTQQTRHSAKDKRQYRHLTHTHSLQYKYHPQENLTKKKIRNRQYTGQPVQTDSTPGSQSKQTVHRAVSPNRQYTGQSVQTDSTPGSQSKQTVHRAVSPNSH